MTSRSSLAHHIDFFEAGRIAGWITDLHAPFTPLSIDLWLDDEYLGRYLADLPRPDVAEAKGLPANAIRTGFDIALPNVMKPGQVRRLRLCHPGRSESLIGRDLLMVERFELIRQAEQVAAMLRVGATGTVPQIAPELLQLLMPQWLQSLRQRYATGRELVWEQAETWSAPVLASEQAIVDVIVPVYGGYAETLACIRSVLRARAMTQFELVVINDCSPDLLLKNALRQLAAVEGFTLLENDLNLGFVGTVNRGMRLHPERDVVLLNSDTLVPPGWLDRMQAAAHSQSNMGTVTPFSNRATILSLPCPLMDNDMPIGMDVAGMDELCKGVNAGVVVDIPTAIGFCMYIRREVLQTIGLFDEARWGKGYAEENDFSIKAAGLGWRNVAACDVFVQHHGSVSFGAAKSERLQQNLEKLNAMYPDYPARVQAFIAADPLREARARVNLALLQRTAPRFILHVMHGWGGGVEVAVRDVCERLATDNEAALILRADAHGNMLLSLPCGGLPLSYAPGTAKSHVIQDMRSLGIWHMHIHQTVGLPHWVWQIAAALKVRYDFTLHDYFSVCPRINFVNVDGQFCGQPELQQCESCVSEHTLPTQTRSLYRELGGTVQAWRTFHLRNLKNARTVFAPSQDTAGRISKYTKLPQMRHQPHPEIAINVKPSKQVKKGALRVAVIGAIGLHKGLKLFLETAQYAQSQAIELEFVVVGYTSDDAAFTSLNNVEILGEYAQGQLPGLLKETGCTVALFLSIWPETFSYTLSEAWRAGLCPVVTDLGAQAERVKREKFGVIISPVSQPKEVVAACVKAGNVSRSKNRTIEVASYVQFVADYYRLA